jgi:hypothetical protein
LSGFTILGNGSNGKSVPQTLQKPSQFAIVHTCDAIDAHTDGIVNAE